MFKEFTGYKAPTVQKINSNCSMATYVPESSNNEYIIGIINYIDNSIIYLKSNTLINISNNIILMLLNNLPKIKNKRVSKKRKQKK